MKMRVWTFLKGVTGILMTHSQNGGNTSITPSLSESIHPEFRISASLTRRVMDIFTQVRSTYPLSRT